MTAKGSPAWYRRHDAPGDLDAERASRRQYARANGMFDESSERPAFEAWFADSRKVRGAIYLGSAFQRMQDGTYQREDVQRHWFTWQMAVGGGRLLPKYDPYKLGLAELQAAGGYRL